MEYVVQELKNGLAVQLFNMRTGFPKGRVMLHDTHIPNIKIVGLEFWGSVSAGDVIRAFDCINEVSKEMGLALIWNYGRDKQFLKFIQCDDSLGFETQLSCVSLLGEQLEVLTNVDTETIFASVLGVILFI